jgi:hypothetical protein
MHFFYNVNSKSIFNPAPKLVLKAPAELRLPGPNAAQLEHEVVTVRVPGEIK